MVQSKNSRVCKQAVSPLLLTKMVPLGWHSNFRVLSLNASRKSITGVHQNLGFPTLLSVSFQAGFSHLLSARPLKVGVVQTLLSALFSLFFFFKVNENPGLTSSS